MSEKAPQPDLSLPDEDITELGQSLDEFREADKAAERPLTKEEQDDLHNEILDEFWEKRKEIDETQLTLVRLRQEMDEMEKKVGLLVDQKKLRPIEMGQVILEATQQQDEVSEAAPATTTVDKKEHKRVSTGIMHAGEVHHDRAKPPLTVEDRPKQPAKRGWAAFEEDVTRLKDKVEHKALPWLEDDVKPIALETPGVSKPEETPPVEKAEDGYYYGGKKVTVARSEPGQDGEGSTLEVVDDEGNGSTIREDQLEIWLNGVKKDKQDFEPKPGKELELYDKGTSKEVELYKQEEKPEEAKKWFARNREKYGVHYWHAKWMAVKDNVAGAYDSVLNIGVNVGVEKALNKGVVDTMTEDEKRIKQEQNRAEKQEENRKRNRTIMLVTVGTLGALLVGDLLAHAVHPGESGIAPPAPKGNRFPGLPGWNNPPGAGHGGLETPPLRAPTETLPFTPNVNPTYNIASGEGGLELFGKLNLDSNTWYAHQEELLHNFPNDFYQNPGQAVRIAHSGWLSPEAQKYIESLKN
jgi:hypothetical protein